MSYCREQDDAAAASPFADALYTAQLRLLLAAKVPIAGAAQDLPSLLADLRQWQPSTLSSPSKQLIDSISYCAQLHSTIAWLAELSSVEAEHQLHHALLQSGSSGRCTASLLRILTNVCLYQTSSNNAQAVCQICWTGQHAGWALGLGQRPGLMQ